MMVKDRGGERGAAPIDLAVLEAAVGADREMHCEILELFVETARQGAEALQDAARIEACDRVAFEAHKLKSAARAIGAHRLADTTEALESAGKAEDGRAVERLLPEFRQALSELVQYLEGTTG